MAPRPREIHRTPKAAKELAALKAQMEKMQSDEGKAGPDPLPTSPPSA